MSEFKDTTTVKCSTSELKEIISLRTKPKFMQTSMDFPKEFPERTFKKSDESMRVLVKQYKSKHSPGILIRGLRENNPKNLISDYPLTKNFTSLNSINHDTLKSLLTVEDVGQEGMAIQTEKIAMNLRNNPGNMKENQKRRLKALFMTKEDFFPFRDKNISFIQKFKNKLENNIKKNYEEEQDVMMKVEGSIEKKIQKNSQTHIEQESLDWTKNSKEEKSLLNRMEEILNKYHKKTMSLM